MNNVYIEEIAKALSPALGLQDDGQDAKVAEKALEWLTGYLESQLKKCLQTQETGVCDMTWKHDDCALLMSMLYEFTQDGRYKTNWTF